MFGRKRLERELREAFAGQIRDGLATIEARIAAEVASQVRPFAELPLRFETFLEEAEGLVEATERNRKRTATALSRMQGAEATNHEAQADPLAKMDPVARAHYEWSLKAARG